MGHPELVDIRVLNCQKQWEQLATKVVMSKQFIYLIAYLINVKEIKRNWAIENVNISWNMIWLKYKMD